MNLLNTHAVSALPVAEDRSHEILGLIRHVFAEKGFDGASMQDLARAAGMSVGNFYRYFLSKAAIVEAMVALDLREIEADFAKILSSPEPLVSLRAGMVQRLGADCRQDGQLWAEINAAAIRKPEIAAASLGMEAAIVENFLTIFARATGLESTVVAARYRAHCQLLVMIVKATMIRSSLNGPAEADLAGLIMRTIDQTIGEISKDIAKV